MPVHNLTCPVIQLAGMQHITGIKQLSDQHKRELGFVNRAIFEKAITAEELLVATSPENDVGLEVFGFVHFYVRRDAIVTLYSIVVNQTYRDSGLGRRLFEALVHVARERGKTQIRLKCPAELPANLFYERLGLEIVEIEPGKQRPLNIWLYNIESL